MVIKETEKFVLSFSEDDMVYDISIKYEHGACVIAHIFGGKHKMPSLQCVSTNLQDCILTWDLYKEFIMLVDDAFERLEIYNKQYE